MKSIEIGIEGERNVFSNLICSGANLRVKSISPHVLIFLVDTVRLLIMTST